MGRNSSSRIRPWTRARTGGTSSPKSSTGRRIYDELSKEIERLVAEPQLSCFQEVLADIQPDGYEVLEKRYYPEMVLVEGGQFAMGSEEEKPIHDVKLNSFRIARTPATFWQFGLFCTATGRKVQQHSPSWGIFGDNPLVYVNWYDAVEYANWLSAQLNVREVYTIDKDRKDPNNENEYDDIKWSVKPNWDAPGFRLPTEAEWEYAARGGPGSKGFEFAGSNNLDEVGWYSQNCEMNGVQRTRPVQRKQPNELGLYDMSGNVWEWCWDWFEDYSPEPMDNPRGPERGSRRVDRGGSWLGGAGFCRTAYRYAIHADNRHVSQGFRLVCVPQFQAGSSGPHL